MTVERLFSPCPRGLEPALAHELRALGAQVLAEPPGGVSWEADAATACRANLESRIASRVLMQVGIGPYRDEEDLYRLASDVGWEAHFDASHTLRVDVVASRSPLHSLNFAMLRVKDAIVDRLREATGERPSIDTREPDVRVSCHLDTGTATLYLDLSGEPLFKRGWRRREDKGEAPLKENLAAGLLALSGWTPGQPFADPFCGSGTLVIEAAQIAAGIAPGLSRRFGFEALRSTDHEAWQRVRADAIRRAQSSDRTGAPILGSDVDAAEVARARTNLARAGIDPARVRLERADATRIARPCEAPGVVVTNPPYGERIGLRDDAGGDAAYVETMRALGAHWRATMAGWTLWVLTSDRGLPGRLGLREKRKVPLWNGALECRLFGFEMRERAPRPSA